MKHIFKNKRNILIMMFALVVIMGIGFAAYSQQLKINETSSIDSNWDVYIKSVDVKNTKGGATGHGTVDSKTAASLTTDLKYPGDNVIYNITVANDGTIDALLEKINFNMEKENTVIKYYYSVDDEATWNEVTKASENPYDLDLLANTTDEFQVKVEYDPTKTGTATADQKSNKLTLNLDYVQKTGGGTVVPGKSALEMLKEKVTTTGDGLYEDEYESTEDVKRYVYKGANPSNYITFNEENDGKAGWRILSIETDGTLKLIRTSSIGKMAFDTYQSSDNHWKKPATINTYLNGEYYNSFNDAEKAQILNHNFNIGPVIDYNVDLSSQITLEKSVIWNGNVGLLNSSDFIRANINKSGCGNFKLHADNALTCMSTNYLVPSNDAWTINQFYDNGYRVMTFASNGKTSNNEVDSQSGVYPVIYIDSNITLSGEGTSDDPYTIN